MNDRILSNLSSRLVRTGSHNGDEEPDFEETIEKEETKEEKHLDFLTFKGNLFEQVGDFEAEER